MADINLKQLFSALLFSALAEAAFGQAPPALLSQNNLYSDISTFTVNSDNLAFAPIYPLFSDYARKSRWLSLPKGSQINTANPDQWVYPVGTKFWKEFQFNDSSRGAYQRVETRLIQKDVVDGQETWNFYTYVWNAAGTDAALDDGSGDMDIFPTSATTSHDVPNRAACNYCHQSAAEPVLGFNLLQLSSVRDPNAIHGEPLPVGGITTKELNARKLFSAPQIDNATIQAPDEITRVAVGYLYVNCGNCHAPKGKAEYTGFLSHYFAAAEAGRFWAIETGANQLNTYYSGLPYRIMGGEPAQSAVIQRMQVEGHFFPRMPIIGSEMIDVSAIKHLSQWITQLPGP